MLNSFLQYVHITTEPVGFLLYSPFAVVLMLTHIYTPFVFLPLYASLEHIPRSLVEASHDLGASPRTTFFRVILPCRCRDFWRVQRLRFSCRSAIFWHRFSSAGPSSVMIANIVQNLFGAAFDWPLGAAISVCILLLTVSLLFLTERLEKRWSFT